MDDNTKLKLLLLGGALTTVGTGWFLNNRLRKALSETPNLSPRQLPNVYKSVGIPENFPTLPVKKLNNAYYSASSHGLSKEQEKQLDPKLLKEKGYIAYDPDFNKAGILAHEAGHAAIRTNHKWYHPKRFNQSVLRTISGLLLPLSTTAAIGVGAGTENPLYGALTGLGAAGVLGAPTLINEHQATGYAKKYLNESTHKPVTKKKNQEALRKAYDTYMSGTLLGPTLAGGLSGGWFMNH